MSIYRNDIQEMEQIELMEVIALHALTVESDDEGWIDADDVIEALEQVEGTVYECVEADILDSIYNGNWTEAAKMMLDKFISPSTLVEYIEDYRYTEYEEAYEFFDLSSAVVITQLYEEQRRVV